VALAALVVVVACVALAVLVVVVVCVVLAKLVVVVACVALAVLVFGVACVVLAVLVVVVACVVLLPRSAGQARIALVTCLCRVHSAVQYRAVRTASQHGTAARVLMGFRPASERRDRYVLLRAAR
jgi:hypothetical protein